MTSYETVRLLQRFIDVVENKPNLNAVLSTAESQHTLISEWVLDLVTISDTSKAGAAIANFNNRLINAFAGEIKETGSRKVYAEVEEMLSHMASIHATYGESFASLNALIDQLTVFINRI